MKTTSTKQNHRFSPVASRDTISSPTKPRLASQASRKATTRLFAAPINDFEPPLSGYGALNSQVGETQYFAQFGVDVQLPKARLYSVSPPSSPSSGLPSTPPDNHTTSSDSPLKTYSWRMRGVMLGNGCPTHLDLSQNGLDDALKDGFIGQGEGLEEEEEEEEDWEEPDLNWPYFVDRHGKSHDFSQLPWEDSVKPQNEDVKIKYEQMFDDGLLGLHSDVVNTTHEVEALTELDEFETWLVFRVRAAHAKGESAVAALRKLYEGLNVLRNKVRTLKAENLELTTQMGKIKALVSTAN
ncbi:hypothetical protein R3P38DRAFT_2792967 [Favolaschia claudopus]|uniref:Uncharacterized protein n=1 Tax=Favolaschia claudopus TaxID=2862362 RepID=A0AAW0ADT6_9AGAR